MRQTLQRQIILEAVQKMHRHPTAEEVYQAIHQEHPTISKATVYRNLQQFSRKGEVAPVQIPGSPTRFDDRLSQHYHFHCTLCDQVYDVDMEYLADINQDVARRYGFQVDQHDIIFKGKCPECSGEEPTP